MAHAAGDSKKRISGFPRKTRTQLGNVSPQEGAALGADNHSFVGDDPEEAAAAERWKIKYISVQAVKRYGEKEQAGELIVGMKLHLALYRVYRLGDHEDVIPIPITVNDLVSGVSCQTSALKYRPQLVERRRRRVVGVSQLQGAVSVQSKYSLHHLRIHSVSAYEVQQSFVCLYELHIGNLRQAVQCVVQLLELPAHPLRDLVDRRELALLEFDRPLGDERPVERERHTLNQQTKSHRDADDQSYLRAWTHVQLAQVLNWQPPASESQVGERSYNARESRSARAFVDIADAGHGRRVAGADARGTVR